MCKDYGSLLVCVFYHASCYTCWKRGAVRPFMETQIAGNFGELYNPRRMRKGYDSCSVGVCLSVSYQTNFW